MHAACWQMLPGWPCSPQWCKHNNIQYIYFKLMEWQKNQCQFNFRNFFLLLFIRLKSLGSLESLKLGNTLKKEILILRTDHLWWKIVMQASDRDWPAHVLTFGVCPLCWTTPIAHALHFYFFSQPSIFFFLHSHSVYCLCCGLLAVPRCHLSLQLTPVVRTRPSDPTTGAEHRTWKRGKITQDCWEKWRYT